MTTIAPLPLETPSLIIDVIGRPAPKGSHKCVGGRGTMRHRLVEMSPLLPAWTSAVVRAASARARLTGFATLRGATSVEIWSWFERPKSAPDREYPIMRSVGDIDKIGRACLDALTAAKVIADDSLVVDLLLHERYATKQETGARIVVVAL